MKQYQYVKVTISKLPQSRAKLSKTWLPAWFILKTGNGATGLEASIRTPRKRQAGRTGAGSVVTDGATRGGAGTLRWAVIIIQ